MWAQPEELSRIVGDPGPADEVAQRLRGRRVLLAGIGTSWHAAHHGAWLLREAGVEASAAHAAGPRARTAGSPTPSRPSSC